MYILGVDPGLVNTGVAIIKINQNKKIEFISSKTIKTNSNDKIDCRLKFINDEIQEILLNNKIYKASIEKTLVNVNAKTSIDLAMSKAIILLNFAKFNISYLDIEPTKIKKNISGHGFASKDEMKSALKYYLDIPNIEKISSHEIDSISIALCCYLFENNKMYNYIQ